MIWWTDSYKDEKFDRKSKFIINLNMNKNH